MDPFTDLLDGLKNQPKASLPEGFEDAVVHNWFNKIPKRKTVSIAALYAVAACFTVFTLTNILLFKNSLTDFEASVAIQNKLNETEAVTAQYEFAEAYGFVETSYYSLNK